MPANRCYFMQMTSGLYKIPLIHHDIFLSLYLLYYMIAMVSLRYKVTSIDGSLCSISEVPFNNLS